MVLPEPPTMSPKPRSILRPISPGPRDPSPFPRWGQSSSPGDGSRAGNSTGRNWRIHVVDESHGRGRSAGPLSRCARRPPVRAASHQWRFNELFSNADGTIQFVEMQECCGFTGETSLSSKWILAVHADHKYTFRSNLTGNTANRYLLLATQGFADTPGAPAPDIIIPSGFLPSDGDTLEHWQYPDATRQYGALPQDGVTALEIGPGPDGISGTDDDINVTAVNSPTNYAGESGSINVTVPVRPTTWGMIKARALRLQ